MKLLIVFLFVLINVTVKSYSQSWEHYYLPLQGYSNYASSIKQTYDGGYVLSVINQGNQHQRFYKLDRDGNIIWSKILFCSSGYQSISDLVETPDGGLILVGGSDCYDPATASFIMKIDQCGETKWIKEYGTFNYYDYAYRVIKLNDGNYLAGIRHYISNQNDRVLLLKFDELGNTIWSGDYTHYNNSDLNDITESQDSKIYISGRAYHSFMGSPNYIRTHYIKVDSLGNEIWNQLYGLQDSILSVAKSSILLGDTASILLSIYNDPVYAIKYWSYLIKVDSSGQEIWRKFLSPQDNLSEDAHRINKLNDSTAIVFNNVSYSTNLNTIDLYHLKAIKINIEGDVLDSAQFGNGINFMFNSIVNDDNDVVVCGEHISGSQRGPFVIKINQDLEIDTLLNISYNYDSLCTTPIITDTIVYDTTVVSYNEIKQFSSIKIYPTIISENKIHIDCQNVNEEANLIIYDISGRNVFSKSLYLNSGITDLILPEYFVNGPYYLQLFLIDEIYNKKILIWNGK